MSSDLPVVGEVIPAGLKFGRWLYVTQVEAEHVFGHVWDRSRGWSKGRTAYARSAVFKVVPGGQKPVPPVRA